jgi:transposase
VPVLKKSRWLLLTREENLKTEPRFRLRDLLRYKLKTVRAYLLKEAFQQLWDYSSPAWAGKFLNGGFGRSTINWSIASMPMSWWPFWHIA